jgi:hypothetical protein
MTGPSHAADDLEQRPRLNPGTLPEVLNPSDLININDALSALFTKLRFALSFYQNRQSDRTATVVSLNAAWEFLLCFDPALNEQLCLPLLNLSSALMALNDNNVAPILSPAAAPNGGRAFASPDRLVLIGIAVGTVARLLWTEMPVGKACEVVAAELVKLGIKSARGNRQITARTIKEWRDRVNADRAAMNSILVGGQDAIANADEKQVARFVAVINADLMTTAKRKSRLGRQPQSAARRYILDALRLSIQARLAGANAPSVVESASPLS